MKIRRIKTIETSNYCFRYADDFVDLGADLNLYPEDGLLDPVLELLHHIEALDKEHKDLLDEREDLLDQVSDLEADIVNLRARETKIKTILADLEEKE
jgi:hypothetical protein